MPLSRIVVLTTGIEGGCRDMWRDQRVSVVFPTYKERASLYQACRDAWDCGFIDEVIVVDNNAEPGSADEARRGGARVVHEPTQGYGAAIQRGLREATGELLLVSEPDGTFSAQDFVKLLAYSDDFDVVYGTRTTLQLIWGGANMGWFLRLGNVAVAKFAEVLFNTAQLSDVGCTMRLMRRNAYEQMAPLFSVEGSHFGPEMMVLSFLLGLRVIQIPVNYRVRVGQSAVTGDVVTSLKVGVQMIALIARYRLTGRRMGHVPLRHEWMVEISGVAAHAAVSAPRE